MPSEAKRPNALETSTLAETPARRDDDGQHRAHVSAVEKMVTPAAMGEAVARLKQGYELSHRRACSLIGALDSSWCGMGTGGQLTARHCGAAEMRRRFSYRRLHAILRPDSHVLNCKRPSGSTERRGYLFAAEEAANGLLAPGHCL